MNLTPSLSIMLCLLAAPYVAYAAILYDSTANAIHVRDYPSVAPCTPGIMLRLDKINSWGRVEYESATDTYIVNADLVIGSDDGTDTYFQIGCKASPRQTLIVRGNVVVHPGCFIKDAQTVPRTLPVNKLIIGRRDDPDVQPTLKIDSRSDNKKSLFAGALPEADDFLYGPGAHLNVYYGTITSLNPRLENYIGVPGGNFGMYLTGTVVLRGATVSRVTGLMTFGLSRNCVVENTVFEHGGTAIANARQQTFSNLVFRNLETAVLDRGALDLTLTECRFEANAVNWSLQHSSSGLVLVDCEYDAPSRGNIYRRIDREADVRRQPRVESRRHVRVKVVDQAGNAVADAAVEVSCEQNDWLCVTHAQTTTDQQGLTPGPDTPGAILLTDYIECAGIAPGTSERHEYSYSITVSAPGFLTGRVEKVRPVHSWQCAVIQMRQE